MPKTVVSPWQPNKMKASALFSPLLPYVSPFLNFSDWPTVEQLNAQLFTEKNKIESAQGATIKLVAQDPKPTHLNAHYAPRIYFSGEIQTRERNWHDFFQAVTWSMFPQTKVIINSLHYPAARARLEQKQPKGKRSALENALSQFDECGVIILCNDRTLLEAITAFDWHTLFWRRRDELKRKLRCVTFGHAIYEKAINPYIGLTAKAILCPVDRLPNDDLELLRTCDEQVATRFQRGGIINSPKDLNPFPILGMPGFFHGNISEAFYHNKSYFRDKPRAPKTEPIDDAKSLAV